MRNTVPRRAMLVAIAQFAAFATIMTGIGPVGFSAANAQTAPTVKWQLQVMQDGVQVDSFAASTAVGQSFNDTHRRNVTNDVGCLNQPAAHIDLSRTLSVSPTDATPDQVTLAIDAQETLQENNSKQTIEGCTVPPQPRQVSARHPALIVPAGQWSTWKIVDKNPELVYRVRADMVTP
jgi:hypothetical protein